MATRLTSGCGLAAELVVELTTRLQQAWQQRHGLLENLAALPATGSPHPLKYLQGARQEYLRTPALACIRQPHTTVHGLRGHP